MAYENVNVSNLKSALNKIDNISSDKLSSLCNSLNKSDWNSPVQDRIKEALNKIINEYKEITKIANNSKNVATYIDQYKDLEKDIKSYKNSLSNAKANLRNCDPENTILKNYYSNQVTNYNNKINSATSRKNSLASQINSIVK